MRGFLFSPSHFLSLVGLASILRGFFYSVGWTLRKEPRTIVIEKLSNNQRGGKREGAGRKAGEPNKLTKQALETAKAMGKTPLEVMLEIMNDSSDDRMRLTAAQAAAPYVHAKLSSVELTGKDGGAVETVSRIELVALK